MTKPTSLHTIKNHNIIHHLTRNALIGLILTSLALFIGMLGYHHYESMPWVDAFLNASMILSGMGPAEILKTDGGKIFAGFYALFSGLAFIALVAILLSPFIHRFFHKLHVEGIEK